MSQSLAGVRVPSPFDEAARQIGGLVAGIWRRGAFWSDRYHCTLVDGGDYAWNCMKYIDLNVVRARVVVHPSEWHWCGYDELVGARQRYRLLDLDSVLEWQGRMSRETFIQDYQPAIRDSIRKGEPEREALWTESIAVAVKSLISG